MRTAPATLFLVPLTLALFAGCTGTEPAPDPAMDPGPSDSSEPPPIVPTPNPATTGVKVTGPNLSGQPLNFTWRETVVPDVRAFDRQVAVCSSSASACYHTPFAVHEGTTLQVAMVWLDERNDFDLHLYEGNRLVASSAQEVPGIDEGFEVALGPAKYDLVVVAWVVDADSFALSAAFTAPAAENPETTCTGSPLLGVGPISLGRRTCQSG